MIPKPQRHPFEPLYDENSRILILGSFPSVKSREMLFYYGHPQNRFWRVMAAVLDSEVPNSIEEKKRLMLSHGIALWDSIASCTIAGSSDSSIKDVVPNNIGSILEAAPIQRICCNGKTSYNCYMKYNYPVTKLEADALPSTSPANVAYSLDRLVGEWQRILR